MLDTNFSDKNNINKSAYTLQTNKGVGRKIFRRGEPTKKDRKIAKTKKTKNSKNTKK